MWVALMEFWAGLVVGWAFGWDRGKRRGDLAHQACHAVQAAALGQVLDTMIEHADVAAWEEEL